jgi:transposase-like protein
VKALGIDGISRSEVSRICKVLDDEVRTFLARPIEAPCPYVWLDATFHKVREAGRVISVATVVATGVTATGERTVLGAVRRATTTSTHELRRGLESTCGGAEDDGQADAGT